MNILGLDPSKFVRRKVDMSIPEKVEPLQTQIYREAEKQAKAQLGHDFTELCLDSEFDIKSTETPFNIRVATILKDTVRKHEYLQSRVKK